MIDTDNLNVRVIRTELVRDFGLHTTAPPPEPRRGLIHQARHPRTPLVRTHHPSKRENQKNPHPGRNSAINGEYYIS